MDGRKGGLAWSWLLDCCLVMIHEWLCGRERERGIILSLSDVWFVHLDRELRSVGRWVGSVARGARGTIRGFCLSRTFVYVHITYYEYFTHASFIGSESCCSLGFCGSKVEVEIKPAELTKSV